jgi:hypothetical protein
MHPQVNGILFPFSVPKMHTVPDLIYSEAEGLYMVNPFLQTISTVRASFIIVEPVARPP